MFMTFDLERYRSELAPLRLSQEQEDELLSDLWTIAQIAFDQLEDPEFFPLHCQLAQGTIDAIEAELEVESRKQSAETEEKQTNQAFNHAAKEDV